MDGRRKAGIVLAGVGVGLDRATTAPGAAARQAAAARPAALTTRFKAAGITG
eukprot:SAG11_NODE_7756_length_1100_cov_1.793207_1_plen_52_part_00